MRIFESIGIVIAIIAMLLLGVVFMYLSYILAVGMAIITLIYITYEVLGYLKHPQV